MSGSLAGLVCPLAPSTPAVDLVTGPARAEQPRNGVDQARPSIELLRCSHCNSYVKFDAQYCYYCRVKLEPPPIARASGGSELDEESTEVMSHESNDAPVSIRSELATIGTVVCVIGGSLQVLAVAYQTGAARGGAQGAVANIALGLVFILLLWFVDGFVDRRLSRRRNLAGQVGAELDPRLSVESGANLFCGQENTSTMGGADSSFGCGSDV